jgi:FKBP-type peptidyl-prolyl cis-trans isomerase (trigger factor)
MTKTLIDKKADGTVSLTITIPQSSIKKSREVVLEEMTKRADLPGFRKGKAPKEIVEEKINRDQLNEDILKKLLPTAYMEAIQEHNLKPIMNPQLHVDKLEEDTDWVITATTCEMPAVDLGTYKKNIQKVTVKSKIVIPGKETEKPKTEDIIKALIESVTVKVPQILIDQETDRLLSQLLNDIKKLGLNLEQYLGTTKRSPDDLRKEYAERAETDIKIEFTLQKIAETEKITVENNEIDEAIQKAKDPAERQNLESNKYLLASILRQQKTLDFLMNL